MDFPKSSIKAVEEEISLITSYKIAFKGRSGKDVLHDLEKRYMKDTYEGVAVNNELALAFDAGQRAVVQRIKNIIHTDEGEYRQKMENIYARDSS